MGENILHSWQHPQDVPYMIIGAEPKAALYFERAFAQVFPGTITTCSVREAEMAKYLANLYWATRVTFVNEMANICEAFGVDYEHARHAWLADPRMTAVYTQYAGYPPGFDGRCWPKDLDALIASSAAAGYEPEFLHAIADANERFRET
jgi:UDP-glucose 6-dehydrogenase